MAGVAAGHIAEREACQNHGGALRRPSAFRRGSISIVAITAEVEGHERLLDRLKISGWRSACAAS
jgi:hypothetical protein